MSRLRAALAGAVLPRRAARPPVTTLRTGRELPALALRLALPALSLAASAALGGGSAALYVGLVVGVAVALRPHAILLALGVAALAAMYALVGQHDWQLPIVVAVTHAMLQLGAVADAVGWRGRVELAVLRDAGPRFLTVQAVAQAIAALALVLAGAPPLPWLVVGAVAALAVLCWILVQRIRRAHLGA